MDQPQGTIWKITRESVVLSNRVIFQEILYKHDPSEDINTEVVFFDW